MENYLTRYLPGFDFQQGWEGQVVNLLAMQCRKTAMIARQKHMANKADSSAHGKANPLLPPRMQICWKDRWTH